MRRIDWRRYQDRDLGEPTLRDILAELDKPGREPRGDFSALAFRAGLQSLGDLCEGMVLEGVVTDVIAFGAFVDVGVHPGLVHVSQLSTRFVWDPAEVVRVGDRLHVKVTSVDVERQRLCLLVKALDADGPGPRSDCWRSTGPGGGEIRSRRLRGTHLQVGGEGIEAMILGTGRGRHPGRVQAKLRSCLK